MIIQGSPEILRGPRGLNGFGDFGAADTQISADANLEFMKSPEYINWAKSIPRLVVDVNTGYQSPYFGPQPGGTFGPAKDAAYEAYKARAGKVPALTAAKAKELIYQASTTGVSTVEVDLYGGLSVVKKAAAQAGLDVTTQSIQNYEIEQGLSESAATIANKRFIGAEGEALAEQIEADLNSENAALAAQARADLAARGAAAKAEVAAREAAQAKEVANAYYAAQAAARRVEEARTLAAKQAAEAQRARALIAVKALFVQVLEREGDEKGLNYFADRFGDVIDPDELQIFRDMAQPEIDARNKYLADMAATAALTAAANKALADSAATVAARAKAQAANVATETAAAAAELAARAAADAAMKKAVADAAASVAAEAQARDVQAAIDDANRATARSAELALTAAANKALADSNATVAARAAAEAAAKAALTKAAANDAAVVAAVRKDAVNSTGAGGVNPMLILAVAAAAFFIGG